MTASVNPVTLKLEEAATRRNEQKKVFIKILQNWQENDFVWVSFLKTLQA